MMRSSTGSLCDISHFNFGYFQADGIGQTEAAFTGLLATRRSQAVPGREGVPGQAVLQLLRGVSRAAGAEAQHAGRQQRRDNLGVVGAELGSLLAGGDHRNFRREISQPLFQKFGCLGGDPG